MVEGVEVLLLLPIEVVYEGLDAVVDAATAPPIAADGIELLLVPGIGGLSAGWEEDISTTVQFWSSFGRTEMDSEVM